MNRFRKPAGAKAPRGFESHPLRIVNFTLTKDQKTSLQEYGVPALAAFIFLIFESYGNWPELSLTAFVVVIVFAMFAVQEHKNEPLLFLIGVVVGFVVEVGMRVFGYQQVWTAGSLFGVPYWLPILWGVGFVLITRFGVSFRGINPPPRR